MSKFKFGDRANKLRSSQSVILEKMANNAINFFKVKAFDEQGFTDKTLERWAPRKSNAARNIGRKLLVDTGRLRQSITLLYRSKDVVRVGTDVPYAPYVNRGTNNMPAREFIGKSEQLKTINQNEINNWVKRTQ